MTIAQTLGCVDRGYCQEQKNTEETLLRGLGFHIGSELLADEEFNLIVDGFLQFGDMQKYFFHRILDQEPIERAGVAA